MDIRPARKEEVEELKKLYKEIVIDLHKQGEVNIWYEDYPMNMLDGDQKAGQLFCFYDHDRLVGAVALTKDFSHRQHFKFNTPEPTIYINRLAVFMEFRGRGYAHLCMNLIKLWAKDKGYRSVRLMVNHHNAPAIASYKRAGMMWTGDKYFPPLYPAEILLGYEMYLD